MQSPTSPAPPRLLFAGTPAFALVSLQALISSGNPPVAVLTQPDRRAGRGKKLTESPVKQCARQHDIEVLQPETLKDDDVVARLAALEPDLLVVAAYGLILPQRVLDIPAHGALNVHASLLPRWRGAAPVQAAILAGDMQTGISLMEMTAGLDCGPVYVREAVDIGPAETAGSLHDRLASLGASMLVEHLGPILDGSLEATGQDDDEATYAPKITAADARIDWTQPAADILRRIRAFNPVPGAWSTLGDERIKCWQARPAGAGENTPGSIVEAGPDGVVVACGDGHIALTELQRPGRGRVSAREFAAQLAAGERHFE